MGRCTTTLVCTHLYSVCFKKIDKNYYLCLIFHILNLDQINLVPYAGSIRYDYTCIPCRRGFTQPDNNSRLMCRRIVDKDSTVRPPADISDGKKDDNKGKNL